MHLLILYFDIMYISMHIKSFKKSKVKFDIHVIHTFFTQ